MAGVVVRDVAERTVAFVEQVIVVDDGSTDGACAGIGHPRIQLIYLEGKSRKGRGDSFGIQNGARISTPIAIAGIGCRRTARNLRNFPGYSKPFQNPTADLAIGMRDFDIPGVPWASRFGNKLTVFLRAYPFRTVPDGYAMRLRIHRRAFVDAILEAIPEGRVKNGNWQS